MKTFKAFLRNELKQRGLSRIATRIKSVTTDNNSVRVMTIDLFRQDRELLQSILDEYTQGSFDGMQDMYIYDSSKESKEFSFKYAFLNNSFSDDVEEKVKDTLRLKYDVIDDKTSMARLGRWYNAALWQELTKLGEF